MNQSQRGRPPHTKKIRRAKELKTRNLSIREISWAVLHREDPATISKWLKRALV